MIKAKGDRDGRPFLLLGIDDRNVSRLTSGQPIFVDKDEVDIPMDIIILHGPTLADVANALRRGALDLSETKVHRSRVDAHQDPSKKDAN